MRQHQRFIERRMSNKKDLLDYKFCANTNLEQISSSRPSLPSFIILSV
jgi:hypothetical protein